MIVAGLDLATATGVCVGKIGAAPTFFTRDLGKRKPHAMRLAEALKLARHLIADLGVEAIGIEAPIIARHDKKSTNELLMGMCGCVRGWASIQCVVAERFETQTIDKTFLGWVPVGRDSRKAAILKQCQMYGWDPQTQDEADAGAVWETMCVQMSPAYAAASGTLMRGRA